MYLICDINASATTNSKTPYTQARGLAVYGVGSGRDEAVATEERLEEARDRVRQIPRHVRMVGFVEVDLLRDDSAGEITRHHECPLNPRNLGVVQDRVSKFDAPFCGASWHCPVSLLLYCFSVVDSV